MTGTFLGVFGLNFAVITAIMLVLWGFSIRSGDPSRIDAFWPFGFVIIAGVTVLTLHGDPTRATLITVLTALWGLRLGGYLFRRWRRTGADARYIDMLDKGTGNRSLLMLRKVFITQAVVMCLVSLPIQLGQLYRVPRGWTVQAAIGVALAVFGIVSESVADLQMIRFRADPATKGQVMDRGLWRFSRHPNYFGESCTWFGIALVAVVNVPTFVGFLGPLLITFFLLKWSGIGPLEAQMRARKPGYADYMARTSPFILWPPRKRGPQALARSGRVPASVEDRS